MADQIVIMLGTRIESHGDLGELKRREKRERRELDSLFIGSTFESEITTTDNH